MINNTHVSQFIPPLDFMCVTGTWTEIAGQVTGTICKHKAAAAETTVVSIPILIPGNSVALQGAKLVSIEVDYEVLVADCTSITTVLNKVTRGADLAVAVVTQPTVTQSPTAALSKVTDQHKLVVTLSTPEWVSNGAYYILQMTCVCPATTQLDFLGAVANYTLRV